jgi:tetratricopeptide (TPR) repeat protein
MSDLLIEQFCQMLAEHLAESDNNVSKSESTAFLQSVIQADARLRMVFEDRMVQFNQGNGVGFQTWLESGSRGFFGTNYLVHDPAVLREGMATLLDELARRPVGTPSNLPLSRVVQFVGREEDLAKVQAKLQAASTVAVTSVSGMGGVGKTELVLQYAYQHLQTNTYPGGLCWINVRAQDVGLGLLEFARTQLGLPEPPDNRKTLLEKVQWVCCRWQGEPILIVLDDVTDYEVVEPYLDLLNPRFRVLMTTRLQLLASAQRLELAVLTESAALELLRGLVDTPNRIDRQLADAQRLCEWLGYLPLGLELVGRYLARREDLSLVEMLERLESKKLAAQALVQAKQMTAQLGVAAAFQLTWEDEQFPDEAKMLCGLLSLFALAPIPWNLVEKCLPDRDKEALEDCRVEQLLGRSLLSRVGQELFQLHQLLREFFVAKRQQRADDSDLQQRFYQVVIAEAEKVTKKPEKSLIQESTLMIAHLQGAMERLAKPEQALDLATCLNWLAELYDSQGRYGEAEPLLVRSLSIREQQLGTNHPHVATSLNNLAELYDSQGRYGEAEPMYMRSLSIREQQLGNDHPDVATSLNGLANLYESQGRYGEAEALYVRSLSIREQQLGADHPDVAESLQDLAYLYYLQGRYAEAEPLYVQSLSMREKQLGADHVKVSYSLNGLALLYNLQGRYAEAETLLVRSVSISEQQLGTDHPDVATSLNNLALLYNSQGRYGEAEPLFVRSLLIKEQQLGTDHPDVATSLNNLALLYNSQGRYGEAEPLYVRSLSIREQRLGTDHPDVAISLNNLANLYRSQESYDEAEPLYVRSVRILQAQLPADHPLSARILSNLAYLYALQGRYCEAEAFYRQAIPIRSAQLEASHPWRQEAAQRFRALLQNALQAQRTAELSDDPLTQAMLRELWEGEGDGGAIAGTP